MANNKYQLSSKDRDQFDITVNGDNTYAGVH